MILAQTIAPVILNPILYDSKISILQLRNLKSSAERQTTISLIGMSVGRKKDLIIAVSEYDIDYPLKYCEKDGVEEFSSGLCRGSWSLKDPGSGIVPQILPRLFTKFTSKSEKGTGLRLLYYHVS